MLCQLYSRTKFTSKYQHKTNVRYTHSNQNVSIMHLYECFNKTDCILGQLSILKYVHLRNSLTDTLTSQTQLTFKYWLKSRKHLYTIYYWDVNGTFTYHSWNCACLWSIKLTETDLIKWYVHYLEPFHPWPPITHRKSTCIVIKDKRAKFKIVNVYWIFRPISFAIIPRYTRLSLNINPGNTNDASNFHSSVIVKNKYFCTMGILHSSLHNI